MKFRSLCAVGLIGSAIVLTGCKEKSEPVQEATEITFETNEQKISYSIGQNFATQLSQSGLAVDTDALKAGIDDFFTQTPARLTQEEIAAAQQAVMQELQEQQQKEQEAKSTANQAEGEAFLAANKTKDGVKTTDTGLQYKVITQGDGALPSETDTVSVHYKGTLIDGTEFDSSHKRGEPAQFPVNAVISGWTEALQMMPVGSKYELYIPSNLAYGPGGTGANGPIGPNATLVFEVELLEIIAK